MINPEIREANIGDLNALKIFEQEVIQYERPFASDLKEDPIEYYDLLNLIQRTDAYVIVATIDGEMIGSGYALIKKSKPYKKHEYYAYLGFMYVMPEYRGKGINGKIIDSLIGWSKNRNLSEIHLEVYSENESALSAYKKRGFKPDLLRMRSNTEK